MVADVVAIVVIAFQNIGMAVSYIVGIQDPFRCDVFQFSLFPVMVIMFTFYHALHGKVHSYQICPQVQGHYIVTHCRVYQVIAAGWIIALLFLLTKLIHELIVGTEYDKMSCFDLCFHKQG